MKETAAMLSPSLKAWGPPASRWAPRLRGGLALQLRVRQQVESYRCCSSSSNNNNSTRSAGCSTSSSSSSSSSNSSTSSTAKSSSSEVGVTPRGSELPVRALTDSSSSNNSSRSNGNSNSSSSSSGSRVYRQPEGFIDFVFKWGVGNAFRAQNANRYRPVHVLRERRVCLPPDYFESPLSAVSFEPLNEAWEVAFFENNKKSSKPFPVKKWGVSAAKREAIAFAQHMQAAGQLEAPRHESGVPGVFWDGMTSSWVCLFRFNGLPVSRSFSAETHGFQQAKLLAEQRATQQQQRQEQLQQQQQRQEQQQQHQQQQEQQQQ